MRPLHLLTGLCSLVLARTALYAPDDPNLYYSPFAWHVNASSASTINSAAYVRFLFSGNALNFTFDVSNMATPASEVYWSVDSGPATLSLVMERVTVVAPANNSNLPFHSVELFVKSTTESQNRWMAGAPNSTRVALTGVETEGDGALAAWLPADVNILVYGDSITEGVLTLGNSQLHDTDHNDASIVYSHTLGGLLGAEVGVVGFGNNALTHYGSGGVPPLGAAWDLLWEGVPRDFAHPPPDLIVLNEGTNDGCDTTSPGCNGTDISALMASVLRNLTSKCPGTPVAVLQPFNGAQKAHLQAAVAATGSPYVHFVETEGFYDMSFGGDLHPTGPNEKGRVAPQIAARLRPLLYQSVLRRWQAS